MRYDSQGPQSVAECIDYDVFEGASGFSDDEFGTFEGAPSQSAQPTLGTVPQVFVTESLDILSSITFPPLKRRGFKPVPLSQLKTEREKSKAAKIDTSCFKWNGTAAEYRLLTKLGIGIPVNNPVVISNGLKGDGHKSLEIQGRESGHISKSISSSPRKDSNIELAKIETETMTFRLNTAVAEQSCREFIEPTLVEAPLEVGAPIAAIRELEQPSLEAAQVEANNESYNDFDESMFLAAPVEVGEPEEAITELEQPSLEAAQVEANNESYNDFDESLFLAAPGQIEDTSCGECEQATVLVHVERNQPFGNPNPTTLRLSASSEEQSFEALVSPASRYEASKAIDKKAGHGSTIAAHAKMEHIEENNFADFMAATPSLIEPSAKKEKEEALLNILDKMDDLSFITQASICQERGSI